MRIRLRGFVLGLAAVGCAILTTQISSSATSNPPEQRSQSAVTFSARAEVVEVDAVVTDERGIPVPGLLQDDFEILEDGRPRPLAVFTPITLPITEGKSTPLEAPSEPVAEAMSDVQSNAHSFDGRIYVVVLDDLHVAPARSLHVRTAAKNFVSRYVQQDDVAAILTTRGGRDTIQEFTTDKRQLLAAIDHFQGAKLESVTQSSAREYALRREMPNPGRDPDQPISVSDPREFERTRQALSSIQVLRSAVQWLASVHGRRKSLVFLSEGLDVGVVDANNLRSNGRRTGPADVDRATRELLAVATRGNVNIYSVDPSGLIDTDDSAVELDVAPLPDDTGIIDLGVGALQRETRTAQSSLRTFAESTGGFAAVGMNDLSGAFARIVRENSAYYVLGFQPADERSDGSFHTIEVRVRRPGLRVQYRKGYTARSEERGGAVRASDPLRDAVESPLPSPGLPLHVFAPPFKGPRRDASVPVVLHVGAADMQFVERDNLFHNQVDVLVVAINGAGKVVANDRQLTEVRLKRETYETVARVGFRVISRVDLPRGEYQIRAGIREANGGRIGSIRYELTVPDFGEPLSMSGVLVTSARAVLVPTLRPDERLERVLPAPPTTERAFVRGDTVAVFAELYANRTARELLAATELVTPDGHAVFRTSEERIAVAANGRAPYGIQVPLGPVQEGPYVIRIAIRDARSGAAILECRIPVSVESPAAP